MFTLNGSDVIFSKAGGGALMMAGKPVDKQVGDRLLSRRIALGVTAEELAAALGTTDKQVQQWEAGTGRIGAVRLQQITKILDVDPTFFFENEPPNGLKGEAGFKETLSLQTILGPQPSLEVARLIRAFHSIKNPAFREMAIKSVETIAKADRAVNGKLDGG